MVSVTNAAGVLLLLISVFFTTVQSEFVEIGNPPSRNNEHMESVANIAFIMTDFDLVNGTLRQYRISTTGKSSPIRLQIWRPVDQGIYQLLTQTWHKPAPWSTYGVYPGDHIMVQDGDKIGFLHETRETTLVYDFLPQVLGASLVTKEFIQFLPTEGSTYMFGEWIYDPWRFALAVKIDTDYGVGPIVDQTTPIPTTGTIKTFGNEIAEGKSTYRYPGSYILKDFDLKGGYLRKFRFFAARANSTVSLQVWRHLVDDYYQLVGEQTVWTGPGGIVEVEAVPEILVEDGDKLGFSSASPWSVLGYRSPVYIPGGRVQRGATTLFHRLQAGLTSPAVGDSRYFGLTTHTTFMFALAADVDLTNAPTSIPVLLPEKDQHRVVIAVVAGTLASIIALLATIFALYYVTRWRGERKHKIRQLLTQSLREPEEDLMSMNRPLEIVTSSTEETPSSSLEIQNETLQVSSGRARGFRDVEEQTDSPLTDGDGNEATSTVYAYVQHHHGNGRGTIHEGTGEILPLYPAIPETDSEDSPVPPLPPRMGTMSSHAVSFSNSLPNIIDDDNNSEMPNRNEGHLPVVIPEAQSTIRLYPNLDMVHNLPIPSYSTVLRETQAQQNRQRQIQTKGNNRGRPQRTQLETGIPHRPISTQVTTSQPVSKALLQTRKPPCNTVKQIKTASVFDTRQGLYTSAVFDIRIDPLSAAIFDSRLRSTGPCTGSVEPANPIHPRPPDAISSSSWVLFRGESQQRSGTSANTLWGTIRALSQQVSRVGQYSWRLIDSIRYPHMRRMNNSQPSSSSYSSSFSSPTSQQSSSPCDTSVSLYHQRAPPGQYGWFYNSNRTPLKKNSPFIKFFGNKRPAMLEVHGYDNAVVHIMDKEWEVQRENISLHETVSENEAGILMKAEVFGLHGKSVWHTASVRMLKETSSDYEKNLLLQEMQVMKAIKAHPNVLQLMGVSITSDPLLMVVEYCPFGNLQDYLRDLKDRNLQLNIAGHNNYTLTIELVSFGAQIARGMAYLASLRILHRDLAARTVLLGEGRLCKVYNFGFTHNVLESHQYERVSGSRMPIRWMAPESLFSNTYTTKSDVWALGVLLWEIVTLGATPYQGMNASKVIKNVKKGFRMAKPPHCKEELYSVMAQCWKNKAPDRPEFDSLAAMLQSLYDKSQDLIQLEKYPEDYYMYMTKSVPDEIV